MLDFNLLALKLEVYLLANLVVHPWWEHACWHGDLVKVGARSQPGIDLLYSSRVMLSPGGLRPFFVIV